MTEKNEKILREEYLKVSDLVYDIRRDVMVSLKDKKLFQARDYLITGQNSIKSFVSNNKSMEGFGDYKPLVDEMWELLNDIELLLELKS
jgi:hypothetical protein